jgi:hypothetical protein
LKPCHVHLPQDILPVRRFDLVEQRKGSILWYEAIRLAERSNQTLPLHLAAFRHHRWRSHAVRPVSCIRNDLSFVSHAGRASWDQPLLARFIADLQSLPDVLALSKG